jgi:hypothetical protein
MQNVIWNTMNKRILLAGGLIVLGVLGMIDTASANYRYDHDSKDDYKFQNFSYGHPYYSEQQVHRNNRNGYKKYYNDNRYRNDYSHNYRNHNGYRQYKKKRSYRNDRYYNGQVTRHGSSQRSFGNLNSQCFTYRVTSQGGRGGFRFQHNIKDFKRFDNGSYQGSICGHRNVEFELSKLDPAVSVSIEINGKHFSYRAHSGHDRYINNWHRKYFSIRLYH